MNGCRIKKITVCVLVVALCLFLCSCSSKNANLRNHYTISGEIFPSEKRIVATEKITYVNAETVSLKEIYFHLYPNTFKTKETAPYLFDDTSFPYPSGFEEGYITLSDISLNGEALDLVKSTEISGKGSTVLKLALEAPLKPGETAEIKMNFTIKLPPAAERFGIGAHHVNLGNWYPIAAVYDQNGWNLDPYYILGDPFYSDCADYDVSMTAPENYVLAASGALKEKATHNKKHTWSFASSSMRDFAIVGSDLFCTAEATVGKTKVISYYYKADELMGKKVLEDCVAAMKTFNKRFGKYPYPVYSICETTFPSGMEYPGLIFLSKSYYKGAEMSDKIAITSVHETGHQYFYSLVGNDQIDEAWLDEGFAAFSEIVYFEDNGRADIAAQRTAFRLNTSEESIMRDIFDGNVVKPLSEYSTWNDYSAGAYCTGATLLIKLRKDVGDKVFWKIMKIYFNEYEYKIATTDDFIAVAEKTSGKDLGKLFKATLGYTKTLNEKVNSTIKR